MLLDDMTLTITLNISVAYYGGKEVNPTEPLELVQIANKAMYTAKKNGKNGIFLIN